MAKAKKNVAENKEVEVKEVIEVEVNETKIETRNK